ncbi:MAG: hypothetical protein ACE5JG_04655 [Planctomycetota bacterium]
MRKALLPALAAAAVLTAMPACRVHIHGRPGRVAVHDVHVRVPPPPRPRVVVVKGARPGPAHVWIGGHFVWRNGRYSWVKGHWVVPPRPRAVWVAGHWKRSGKGGVWIAGRWK